jgi:hypothetical protein
VDVNLVLESTKSTDIEIGAWINVLGYVKSSSHGNKTKIAAAEKKDGIARSRRSLVKALMVYSSGSIDLGEYERVLFESKEAKKRLGDGG